MRDELDIPYPGQGAAVGGRYASSRDEERFDPAMKRILMFVAAAVVSVGVIAGLVSAVSPKRSGVPVIEASTRPLRERPPATNGATPGATPGATLGATVGATTAGGTGATAASAANDADGKPVMAPAPEAPAIAALNAPAPAPAPAPLPAPSASQIAEATAPAALSPVPAPVATPAPAIASKPPAPVAAPVIASVPAVLAHSAPAGSKPGAALVQLAAVGSEEAAMSEWQRLARRYPDLLATRHPSVSRTEHNGKTYWRLRTGGFADIASATSFCGLVKQRGANCALASF